MPMAQINHLLSLQKLIVIQLNAARRNDIYTCETAARSVWESHFLCAY